ncbi:hypothetical protein GQ543_11010 [candidate division WOR-3 bacterium]|jgi:hypothetical protein|nr:hypothetical protein [candidate division WOR-3 bacterium]
MGKLEVLKLGSWEDGKIRSYEDKKLGRWEKRNPCYYPRESVSISAKISVFSFG